MSAAGERPRRCVPALVAVSPRAAHWLELKRAFALLLYLLPAYMLVRAGHT